MKTKQDKPKRRYAYTATFPMCAALVDIHTGYTKPDSYRHHFQVMFGLMRREWVSKDGTLTALGRKAIDLSRSYVPTQLVQKKRKGPKQAAKTEAKQAQAEKRKAA